MKKEEKQMNEEKERKLEKTIGGLLIGAGITALAGAYAAYRYVFYSSPNREEADDIRPKDPKETEEQYRFQIDKIKALQAVPYEKVYIESFDDLRLTGRYYHISDDAPLAIMFHGYTGTPVRDFSGGYDIFSSLGFNTLIIEERAHCGSEGDTISFGVNERRDVISWLDYARERFGDDKDIILVGISMGAATVLMSIELGLPSNVKGIIADCPYSAPLSIITHAGMMRGLPMKIVLPLARLGAKVFGNFSISSANAARSVKASKVPIMIIHGEDDELVPAYMSKEIEDANPEMIERYTFPGAWHGTSYLVDPVRYAKLVADFTKKVLTK